MITIIVGYSSSYMSDVASDIDCEVKVYFPETHKHPVKAVKLFEEEYGSLKDIVVITHCKQIIDWYCYKVDEGVFDASEVQIIQTHDDHKVATLMWCDDYKECYLRNWQLGFFSL